MDAKWSEKAFFGPGFQHDFVALLNVDRNFAEADVAMHTLGKDVETWDTVRSLSLLDELDVVLGKSLLKGGGVVAFGRHFRLFVSQLWSVLKRAVPLAEELRDFALHHIVAVALEQVLSEDGHFEVEKIQR